MACSGHVFKDQIDEFLDPNIKWLSPVKDQTLTVMSFGDYGQRPEPARAKHEGKWLAWLSPLDHGMSLVKCSWVNGVGHLKLKCTKSFDLWRRADQTDSNTLSRSMTGTFLGLTEVETTSTYFFSKACLVISLELPAVFFSKSLFVFPPTFWDCFPDFF